MKKLISQPTSAFSLALLALALLTLVPLNCYAANIDLTGSKLADDVLATIIYSAIGLVMAFAAFKVIDALTPGDLSKDIANNNTALAIVVGSSMLGICIIIAAAIAG